jgi:hypothetical protein
MYQLLQTSAIFPNTCKKEKLTINKEKLDKNIGGKGEIEEWGEYERRGWRGGGRGT